MTDDAPILGIVSNCWKSQLDRGVPLDHLVEQAFERGYRAIELREGSLGDYEMALRVGDQAALERFAKLAGRFARIHFNLAVALPCFGGTLHDGDRRFTRALTIAKGLAVDGRPHLRLVDTETRERSLDPATIEHAGELLAAFTEHAITHGGRLSVEHAYQRWSDFSTAMLQARVRLGKAGNRLCTCFDPCNLLLTEPLSDVSGIVAGVLPDDVSMIHLKQRREGQIQPDVASGDLDWSALLQALRSNGHDGPWLFEVAPGEDLWQNLDRSVASLFRDQS